MPRIKKTEAFFRILNLSESGKTDNLSKATEILARSIKGETGDNSYTSDIVLSRSEKKVFSI